MRNNKAPFQISILSAAITATLIPGYASAQESGLEEVIVTATRRAQSVQDIPLNITALNSDLIQRQRLTDLSDIARVVPGMTVVDQGPRSGNTLTIRGLTVDSIAAPDQTNNTGGTVATYIGEIPFYVDLKLNDMERVEVLRGPQGTLYGAGTLGGAVRYIPNKPQADSLSYEIRGDVYDLEESSDTGFEGGGTVNIPLIKDALALRASVDYLDDPGFIDYNYLVREAGVSDPQPDFSNSNDVNANLKQKDDVNTEETWSGRLALRYTGEKIDGALTYYYQDAEIGGRQINHRDSFNQGPSGDYVSAHRFEEPNDRKNELLALELVADLGFAELTSATGYGEYTENGQRDQTDLLLDGEYGYEFFPSFSAFTREDSDEDTFTQELRLVSTNESDWNWIVGAFYNTFEQDSVSQEFAPGFDIWATGEDLSPDDLEYVEVLDYELEEIATFGELGYQITDAWQVTVGARWFEFDNDSTGGSTAVLWQVLDGLDPADVEIPLQENKVDDGDIIYKFNTSYDFTDDMMGYFTISEGYRLGGLNPVAPCQEPLPDGQNTCALPNEILIKSDTTTNYEIGLRSSWNNNLIVNGSLFFIDWDDVRVADRTVNGSVPIDSNAGSAESKGVELEAQWYVTPDLSIAGSYSYTDAELTDDVPLFFCDPEIFATPEECATIDGNAYDGDRLPGTPEHQAFLGANYVVMLSGGSHLELDYSMTYTSDVLSKVGERNFGESLDSFTLHGAAVSWIQNGFRLSLYADNLFDEYAETGVRDDPSTIRSVGDDFDVRRYFHSVVRPRQVGLRFVYNFNE